MPQYVVIAAANPPDQGSTANGAMVYRSTNVADPAAAVAEFTSLQDLTYTVKLWVVQASTLVPFRVDVTHSKSAVAE